MRFLEYMGFVLAVFPLKYGFIIVQDDMYIKISISSRHCTRCILIYKMLI